MGALQHQHFNAIEGIAHQRQSGSGSWGHLIVIVSCHNALKIPRQQREYDCVMQPFAV